VKTFRDLITRWPSVAEFARDIGVGYEAARKMRDRGNIDVEHWDTLIQAASARGIKLSTDQLHDMYRRHRGRQCAPNENRVRCVARDPTVAATNAWPTCALKFALRRPADGAGRV